MWTVILIIFSTIVAIFSIASTCCALDEMVKGKANEWTKLQFWFMLIPVVNGICVMGMGIILAVEWVFEKLSLTPSLLKVKYKKFAAWKNKVIAGYKSIGLP